MKKPLVLLSIFIYLLIPQFIQAKNVKYTCDYTGTMDKNATITPSNPEYVGVNINCNIFDDMTNECIINSEKIYSNKEKILNWKDFDEIKSGQNYCPPYLVFVDKESWINRYELYGAATLQEANKKQFEQKTFNYNAVVLKPFGQAENIEEKIQSYIDILNHPETYFQLEDCIKNGNFEFPTTSSLKYGICVSRYREALKKREELDNEVENLIANGKISRDNDLVKKFKEALNHTNDLLNGDNIIDIEPNDTGLNQGNFTCAIFDGQFGKIVRNILNLMKFFVPIIIIATAVVDFIKAIAAQDQKEINKAISRLIKRIIIGVVILVLPTILDFLLKLAGIESGTCGIR